MSVQDPQDNKRVLYLQQIDLQVVTIIRYQIKVQIDGRDVEMRHDQRTSTWTPANILEIPNTSNFKVLIKTGHTLGAHSWKQESQLGVRGQEAIEAFWNSIDAISQETIFDQKPATIIFKFRPSHTLETMRVAVNKLQTEMEKHGVVMTDTVESHINPTLKYGTVLAELDPMFKMAFGLANATFDFLKEQWKYDKTVSDLADGVNQILSFAGRPTEDVLYDNGDPLEKVIKKMYESVVDTATFICDYTKHNVTVSTLVSTPSSEDHRKIADLKDSFSKLKEEFNRVVDVKALELARSNEVDHLLQLLRPTREAEYQDDHGCMEGTQTALLDEIMEWTQKPMHANTKPQGPKTDKIFWLYGMPASGKTLVANSICRRLHQNRNLGGSFFCRRDNPILREPRRVLPTLISELASMWGPFRTLVAQTLRDNPRLNPESTNGELLVGSLNSLNKRPFHSLVLVIDALDECGEEHTRSGLLESLLEASSRVYWLKIILTSRPEHDIKSFCEINGVTNRDITAACDTDQEIRLYIKECMTRVAIRRHLPHDWPWDSCREEISKRSGGSFIFVETLGRLVDVPNPEDPLNRILSSKLEEASVELHKLYLMAITSLVGSFATNFLSIARVIIGIASYRPLREETIASLMGTETRIVTELVDILGSILYRDETQQGAIRVRHVSIVDFLVGTTCPENIRIDMKQANEDLAEYCLRTMTKELKLNICDLETSFLPNSEVKDLGDRVQLKISDALQYSCLHWSSHLSFDLDPASDAVSELLNKFFAKAMPLYWLEVLSVMGNVPVAILSLRRLEGSHKRFDTQIRNRVEDMLCFVLAFSTPISISAPHIYLSTLPFMPIESSLWQRVHGLFPNLLNVCTGRTQIWPERSGAWGGHTNPVSIVAFSPNGRHIVSGSWDHTIRIWNATTGAPLSEPLRGHTSWVSSVAYSPNSQHIISGSWDNTIRIWNTTTGTSVGEPLIGHTDWVTSVAYSPNGQNIVSGSNDETIRIWDVITGAPICDPLRGHTRTVNSVAFSPSGQHVVSGSGDKTIRIWDATTGVPLGEPLRGHTEAVNSIAYSPNGRHIVSGSNDNSLLIWDVTTGTIVGRPLRGHAGRVKSVAYSPNGRYIVSGSDDETIWIWDTTTGAPVGGPLIGHTDTVNSIAYSPDGQHIVSGSNDNTVRIWYTTVVSENDNNMLHDRQALSSFLLRRQAFVSSNYPAQPTPAGFGIAQKLIESDGWVRCNEGLLFWVPEDYQGGLSSSAILTIPSAGHHRCVRVNFDHFRYGSSWTNVRGDESWTPGEGYQSAETVEAPSLEVSDKSSDLQVGSRSIRASVYGVKPDKEMVRLWTDSSSTYGEVYNELAALYQNFAIIVLEPYYGPKPYWQNAVPDQLIGPTCRDVYAIAVKELNGPQRYTVAVVRTAESDYPIAIFGSLSEPAGTVLQAVASSQPDLVNQIKQITYYSSHQDVRQNNYDYENLRNDLLHTFPTAFFITMNDAEQPFMTNRPSESIPPFLQAPLVHCENLLQRGYNLEISPLQTIFVLRAALHLIISLSTAIAPILESGYLSANNQTVDYDDQAAVLRVAPSLAEEVHRIIIAIEGHVKALEGSPPEQDQTVWDIDRIFNSLCGDFPGAVTIRRSQGTLEDLKARDAGDSFYSGEVIESD